MQPILFVISALGAIGMGVTAFTLWLKYGWTAPYREGHVRGNDIQQGINTIFPEAYFTVLSIVQGVAFGFLINNAMHTILKVDITLNWNFILLIFQIFISTSIIVLVWFEYSYFPIIYRWIPSFIDAIVPFGLGFLEILPTFFFNGTSSGWYFWTGLFCFAGGIGAYCNTLFHVPNNFAWEEGRGQQAKEESEKSIKTACFASLLAGWLTFVDLIMIVAGIAKVCLGLLLVPLLLMLYPLGKVIREGQGYLRKIINIYK